MEQPEDEGKGETKDEGKDEDKDEGKDGGKEGEEGDEPEPPSPYADIFVKRATIIEAAAGAGPPGLPEIDSAVAASASAVNSCLPRRHLATATQVGPRIITRSNVGLCQHELKLSIIK